MDHPVDSREDSEQEKKCLEVIELLVAAGYFRARIKVKTSFLEVNAPWPKTSCLIM